MFRALLTLVILTGSTAFAQWRKAEVDWLKSYNALEQTAPGQRGLVGGPYASSVLDTFWLAISGATPDPSKYARVDISLELADRLFVSPDGKKRPLRVISYSQKGMIRAPLVVYLPGIFQDGTDGSSQQAVSELLDAGNQVLLIPNPLTAAYMSNYPVNAPTVFGAEAAAALAAIRTFVAQHRNEVSSVHLAGASYGAFLASILMAKDAESASPVLDGQATLIFPPIDMAESREMLDKMVDVYLDGSWSGEGMIAGAFQSALVALLERMKTQYLEDRNHGFLARRYRPQAITFLDFFDRSRAGDTSRVYFYTVIHEAVGSMDSFYAGESAKIGYWLDRAAAHGNSRVRILTTDDDWLNPPEKWKSLPHWLQNENHLLVHKGGGHAGIVSSDWLAKFVHQSMHVEP